MSTVTTPKIADGPASIYLKIAVAVSAVIAAVTAVLHGDHTPETIAAGLASAAFLVTFAYGKYKQAAALLTHKPAPLDQPPVV